MSEKTYVTDGQDVPASQIGATLDTLAAVIAARRDADDASYTHRLLDGDPDVLARKITEEACEVARAVDDVEQDRACASGKTDDAAETACAHVDHLRYEAADVVYHLMVVLERYGISVDEFAAELNNRMNDQDVPAGGVRLYDEYVQRGK